jgi:hypothetical protein
MVSRFAAPLAVTLLGFVACEKESRSVDPCSGAACETQPPCELGDCIDPVPTLSRSHSEQNGTEIESGAACPHFDGALPPVETVLDTSDIPEFKKGRSRRTNMDTGESLPHNIDLHAELMPLQGRIFECIDIAACYSTDMDPFVSGDLEFQFELEPTGRVSAVSVVPSSTLKDPVVAACARRSLFELKLPKYDGARLTVSYRVEIGEG